MQQRESIDCLIPRGGPSLIASILEHATVPYVIDGDGNCHVYVDEDDFAAVLLHEERECRRHADIAGPNNSHALNTQDAIPVID